MNNETGCKQIILTKSQNGYVVKCKDCNQIKIAFGSHLLKQTIPEFLEFMVKIYKIRECHSGNTNPICKCIEVPTLLRNMSWLFVMNDIENLTKLMEQACLKMGVEQNISYN